MNFNYKNYVKRFKYQPYQWPPDIGLAQLHARCSEPGPVNDEGIQCPCCDRSSKNKITKWWTRSVTDDLNGYGGAIPGYFKLIKYYTLCLGAALLMNSIYPLMITYYVCNNLDPNEQYCLSVGLLYYLDFNRMIEILNENNQQNISYYLLILQTAVFYFLLAVNIFSSFFLIIFRSEKDKQFEENFVADSQKCLLFYNIPKEVQDTFPSMLRVFGDEGVIDIRKTIKVYKIKEYYNNYNHRNELYYHILSKYVQCENPLKSHKKNQDLGNFHEDLKESRKEIGQFSGKMVIFFQDRQLVREIHKSYRMSWRMKWWYGFRTLLNNVGLCSFDAQKMQVSSAKIPKVADIKWENIGEDLGAKMAARIKTVIVAFIFLGLCYALLFFPMIMTLKIESKEQNPNFVKLNTIQKIIPFFTSIILVALSISYRIYMQKLGDQRNPKNDLQKARFVLMTTVLFHLVFYIIMPTVFFAIPNGISRSVKLYVISEQARTFIIIQLLIVLIDLPYRMWKSQKVKSLSDQRKAFKHNQYTLNKIVQSTDYPLEVRLQVMFRFWSFALFYCFFLPYLIYILFVALLIIYWVEKKNLYKHYTVRRKVSVNLQAEFLILFTNFFCIYQCVVFCLTIQNDLQTYLAIGITLLGMAANLGFWIFLNKSNDKKQDLRQSFIKEEGCDEGKQFEEKYQKFIDFHKNYQLEDEIDKYLELATKEKEKRKTKTNLKQLQLSSENSQSDYVA